MAALIAVVVDPAIDLTISGWFYAPGEGFLLDNTHLFDAVHLFAVRGAWWIGRLLAVLTLIALVIRKPLGGVGWKGWLFLLLALLLGPALLANGVLKDHWGRARPHEVTEFGGHAAFTPALLPQPNATRNGSFVSGDGAFGFFLPSFAYLAPLPQRRRLSRGIFWGGIALGAGFAFTRIGMGGHFFSDNLFAALLVLMVSAALHAAMFGRNSTLAYWRVWMGKSSNLNGMTFAIPPRRR